MSSIDRNQCLQIFQRVDADKSGSISSVELQTALSNGNRKAFNPETIRLLMGLFEKDGRSKLGFDEFFALYKYIDDWERVFRSFDRDSSGSIDKNELKQALSSFGYRLSDEFYNTLMKSVKFRFNSQVCANAGKFNDNEITFDTFIFVCCKIKKLSDVFKKFDHQKTETMTIRYEDFLLLILTLHI